MYIITSNKLGIRATSGKNNSVEFHNTLFDTDDCVITWVADPTPAEIEAAKANTIPIEIAPAEEKTYIVDEHVLTDQDIRELVVELAERAGLLADSTKVPWYQKLLKITGQNP